MAKQIEKIKIILSKFYIFRKLFEYISNRRFKNYFKRFRDSKGESIPRFTLEWSDRYACNDNTKNTYFDAHYIYHTAWAARILKKINPKLHIDISSYLYFSSIVSAFIPMQFYDYRPANLILDDLETGKADLCFLPFDDNSIQSLSCMHTIEHIGLGRYGDPIDYNGDLKAINEIKRVLAQDGNLIFVVPIGKPKIEFNAHRIYSYKQIVLNYFSDFRLIDFTLIPDDANKIGMISNASEELCDLQSYGCGCFWFKKTI